jgi:hypothetical protein
MCLENLVRGVLFREAGMDELIGTETLIAHQMLQDHQIEMMDIARTEHSLVSGTMRRPSWVGRTMMKLGDALVFSGTWLKSHYSIQNAYRTR